MLARTVPLALFLLAAADARAETRLALDEGLLVEAARVLAASGAEAPVFLAQVDDEDEEEEDRPRKRRRSARVEDDGAAYRGGGSGFTPMGRPFGIGLQLGFPTAVTIKYMLTGDQGLVAGLGVGSGWAYWAPSLSLHVDYVWHPSLLTSAAAFNLSWYIGGGGWVTIFDRLRRDPLYGYAWYAFPSYFWLGARMPIGVTLALREVPFEIYGEAAPSLLVFPYIGFGIGVAIGARFYF